LNYNECKTEFSIQNYIEIFLNILTRFCSCWLEQTRNELYGLEEKKVKSKLLPAPEILGPFSVVCGICDKTWKEQHFAAKIVFREPTCRFETKSEKNCRVFRADLISVAN
jgi:hypothetical protein